MLEQSLTAASRAETWHNLSVVYSQLGEIDSAAKAKGQAIALSGNRDVRAPGVKWLDAMTFARTVPASDIATSPAAIATTSPATDKPATKKSAALAFIQQ